MVKALTLTQPWASLVALELKRFETRSWSTTWRGPLAIHAAKGFPRWARDLCDEEPFCSALDDHGLDEAALPLGCVVAMSRLVDVIPTVDPRLDDLIDGNEDMFGDYTPGRYAWQLAGIVALPKPIPARGSLGLWEWEP